MKIFYNINGVVQTTNFNTIKPKAIAEQIKGIDIFESKPFLVDDFELAHSHAFVQGIMAGKKLNGFDNLDLKIAATLPFLTGTLLDAALYAKTKDDIAIALCDGGHHAKYELAEDYCTFNHLILVAMKMKQLGLANHIGIIDFDFHYGDGSQHLIDHLKLDYIEHFSAGREYFEPEQAEEFLDDIKRRLCHFGGCDLILYHSGADVLLGDRCGGFLTLEQFKQREKEVFKWFREIYEIPLAVCFGGGYRENTQETVDAHLITIDIAKNLSVSHNAFVA